MNTAKSIRLALVVSLIVAGSSAVAAVASATPGGPAPKALLGTWRTTLTSTDLQRLRAPDAHKGFALVIVNTRYLAYPRALGFGPADSGRDTVPFGVSGHKLYLACLTRDGTPTRGYATYTWRLSGGLLRFARVSEPCRDPFLRDRIVILTSHPWHRG